MSTLITLDQAAQVATEALNRQRQGTSGGPVVSPGCLQNPCSTGRLPQAGPGLVDRDGVEELFARTRILDTTERSFVRVSICPLREGGDVDPLPSGERRMHAGFDFTNSIGASQEQRMAGIEGVWPLSEGPSAPQPRRARCSPRP